ncbi:hypothetical protein RchiOBHm_Chr6g0257691 [Rosa chinensis]|uniref:Uncharacterized protein n=1 Tax=Rosa chinensis TaxID=74649 RepID=A0A2P6PMF6_ROSCH|nr:hypothetical protein RchiOBHm_Chr6g0257691 [Rosa chinensis]
MSLQPIPAYSQSFTARSRSLLTRSVEVNPQTVAGNRHEPTIGFRDPCFTGRPACAFGWRSVADLLACYCMLA